MYRNRLRRTLTASISIMLASSFLLGSMGCIAQKKSVSAIKVPKYVRRVPKNKVSPGTEGSLWAGQGRELFLFSDHKPRRVNDLVTVRIVEDVRASKEASTKTSRISTLSAGVDALLGFGKALADKNRNFNPSSAIKAGHENSFDGSGSTSRSDKFTGTITAMVKSVMPGGNLFIVGSREITINNEKQFIMLSGIVRPRDISPTNVVLSTAIADARIIYTGTGVLSEKQRPGWFSRAMDKVWPF